MNSNKIKIASILFSSVLLTYAQTPDDAKALFAKGEYGKAREAFAKLLKSRPKDPVLNKYFAFCQGEQFYHNYQFDESAAQYKKCTDEPATEPLLKAKAEKCLQQAVTATRLMKGVEQVQIIDSLVVDKTTFMKAYKLSYESGSVDSFNSFFNQTADGVSSVYQNQRKDKIYFSEKTNGKGYQLYVQNKLLDTWGEKIALGDPVNTDANENFPFVLSDGTTLYYASDGDGSIGGYDIFVTRYNLANDNYLAPENVGMPFNSIYNDYLLAIDEQNNIGWFASDRFQAKDKVIIYIFIPNESKKVYENLPQDKLTRLALIHSIKDTWSKSAGYASVLDKIRNINSAVKENKTSAWTFRLVINDKRIYHTWSDFRSEEARSAYREYYQKAIQLKEMQGKLDNLRSEYLSSEASNREEISNAILTLEKSVDELKTNQKELEVKVINIENQNLK